MELGSSPSESAGLTAARHEQIGLFNERWSCRPLCNEDIVEELRQALEKEGINVEEFILWEELASSVPSLNQSQ
jgi:hypothetical protein